MDLALQYHQAGRLRDAEEIYRQILAQYPQHADALHFLGVVAHQVGQNDAAVDLIRRSLALHPRSPVAQNNLGNALKADGKLDAAVTAYLAALALQPVFPEAQNNLATALREQGKLDEAIETYQKAISCRPDYVDAHCNLGNALKDRGQIDLAIASYRTAIVLHPQFAQAYFNLGNALAQKRDLDDAVSAYRQALTLQPDYTDAWYNLGNALVEQGKLDDAVIAYQQTLTLKPGYTAARNMMGVALKDQGRLDDAIAAFRLALTFDPGDIVVNSNLLGTLHFHPGYDARAIAEDHARWNKAQAQPLLSKQAYINERSTLRRLRVGYVSPDFRRHCQVLYTLPLLSHHDRRQFEIFGYADVLEPDDVTAQIKSHCDVWRDIRGQTDAQVTALIRNDRIDILVDLTMHMARNRLLVFARKPAPIQMTWLAYPASTGLTAIDYRLSDPFLDPPGSDESVYSEKILRMPDTFWCFDPHDERDICVNELPANENGFVTFGCLNNFCKVNNGILELWAKVMSEISNSRLLLLAQQGTHRQRTLDFFGNHGVDPGRIEFAGHQPRRSYLDLYHRIDIGLDSFPYNGHTTSLDSFWMGVPVVTLVGARAVSRAGWCQLSNLGLTELAGHTPAAFISIAIKLAGDLPRLKQLRFTLRRRLGQSPLMDAARFTANLEHSYRQIWTSWCGSGV